MTHDTVRDCHKSRKIVLLIPLVFLPVEIAGGQISGFSSPRSSPGATYAKAALLLKKQGSSRLIFPTSYKKQVMVGQ
ncbi:MAG: hypothetical protein WC379_13225 [Methanoregula sp.]